MSINELPILAAWIGTLFAIVGVIAMLIINVKTQNFIIDKLVEFGNASKYLVYPDSKIIKEHGKIKAFIPQKIINKSHMKLIKKMYPIKLEGSMDWKTSSISFGKKKFVR